MAATTAAATVFSFYKLVDCHSFPRTVRSFPGSPMHLRCRAPHLRPHALAAGDPSTELCVVLAGGGSGGHIFPALAIADELSAVRPNARIVFLGTASGMESEVVPSAGYEFVHVPKVCLARPFLSPLNLLLPFQLLRSIIASAAVLSRLRPKVVVGTGAYVSAPVCFAAIISGIMLVIQEQNCYPGITNRALAPYAEKIFLAFNACIKYFPRDKCVVCGNPRRLSSGSGGGVSKADARQHFFPESGNMDLDERALVVLVLGGSIGANAMNLAFLEVCYDMLAKQNNIFIIWQTGAKWFEDVKRVAKVHPRLFLTPFLDAMELAYAAADLVVSRAGAMTCTEILTAGKPSILIPSPTASDDHQTKNAYAMADLAGAHVLTEDELDSCSLQTAINNVLGDNNLMEEMSEKARRASRPNAASHIAECILSILV
ncbi:UDP-N-acetylglucosamine--N-acetylmuramyl-(pentapeptide) pyrophosphoryl-undecaprenol N-acetylglucosamine transferase [Dendrobium catenatum]|uniref:UDP-N-acetylglucosamine--N-acetylmuramyl-(Pentapeptide) pyrophosphoryl-undecaprenol N-acetylglucosamine transferase n=2 Tax=Dendrobium catenatum TaxID=906689 RepID=A0A2I0XC37_9ASPA|nr:UDP-N-acetylglucosamine--N-acetylmuramyl-(pentapeptide) pyrophosphoryl-undecaprenol N-acetylglucosamine transferase [Dendrobium catenatum]